jgi:UDP-N-acetylglucosamine 2-epimerase (non-hydrolysing)
MKKLLFVYGTRPEAIKLAPVVLRAREREGLEPVVCVTAQHRELLDQVHDLFGIEPTHELGLMRPNQALNELAARALQGLGKVLLQERPDAVVVQGDTTTAFAGALAAFHERIPVAHVEAGLRTYDLTAPFPEELNRQLIGRMARWHFAPTVKAEGHLVREGVARDAILVTGNTAIDALQHVEGKLRMGAAIPDGTPRTMPGSKLVVVTAHRRESFGDPMDDVCDAIERMVRKHEDVEVVFSVHPNPNVKGRVHARLGDVPRVHMVDPLGYLAFVSLLSEAWLIITDSGGIQEEAPGLGKPVLVTRAKTERPEAVDAGTARLVGTSPARILEAVDELHSDREAYRRMAGAPNPFGDGRAATRILDRLCKELDA